jgi:hypothetical protein
MKIPSGCRTFKAAPQGAEGSIWNKSAAADVAGTKANSLPFRGRLKIASSMRRLEVIHVRSLHCTRFASTSARVRASGSHWWQGARSERRVVAGL